MKSHSKENMLKALVSIKDVPGSELMTQLSTLRQGLNIFLKEGIINFPV